MYSLYRAWLSLSPCTGLPPLTAQPIPLNLSVPSHSGQIPEAPDVTLQVGPSMTHFSAHRSILSMHSGFFKAALANHAGLSPILVPNVNVDEFSSLLTFMYTGYLDLNITNIYSILLATHMLHMPRALELCRSFLLHQQPVTETHDTPKINVIKPIASRKMAPSMQEVFGPLTYGTITKSEETSFKTVKEETTASASVSTPTTSKSIMKSCTSTGESSKNSQEKKPAPHKNNKKKQDMSSSKDKVIVDVACCDGPVRFHRVINKNYGIQDTENFDTSSANFRVSEFNRSSAMNKVMNENIMEKLNGNEDLAFNEVFTCVYCNHTFKSQYCYQKHARRHLYPVSVDKVAQAEAKREVKLLDMNVQYYPCKTCGSKFPSYYFVHKHRKMCHAEEVADKDNKNNEIVVESAVAREESSSCSAIDVEGDIQNVNDQEVT
ncbi:telomere zinc finger-associated protein isoform X2 [Anthonomus grandis grandis]|nr:telomere zinc finger-associated protein isoform X2 [Anthonomus grandis grandis]XP_050299375.1 telomere zinc finger-associated protein isoform X2 [Anthonomus grandis grandis]